LAARIRIGIVGAGLARGWAKQAHLPALPHLPEYELTGVCASRADTAAAAASAYGARYAFHDYRELIAHPEIDAVVVSVKTPQHYDITRAALEARKPVYTEWPLGANLTQTEDLAQRAAAAGVHAMVGLQGRVGPANLYVRDLVRDGFVGEVLSCCIYRITERPPVDEATVWSADASQGATAVTIDAGHTLDTLASIVGEFRELSAQVSIQRNPVPRADTGERISFSAPDHVLVQGVLEDGAAASAHVAIVPGPASGGRLEIYGTEGMLMATSPESLHRGVVTVAGARTGETSRVLPIPARYRWVPAEVPAAAPINVAQLYRLFARALGGEKAEYPDFRDAVRRYRLLDAVVRASESSARVKLQPLDGR
jgi:predicted dehydrogenase